ncbi:MAG TPA: lipase family protein [Longimicrobiales bacterium]|nr:lipase family protein [Longimicrobiales bacterium]
MGNFQELFGPNETYDYFQLAGTHAFQTESDGFSLVNASWLADAALLSYLEEEADVQRRLASAGLEGRCIGFGRPGAQAFVAHGRGWALVSFRGTEDWKDALQDLEANLGERPPHRGEVHSGFHRALSSIWDRVSQELEALPRPATGPLPVWFTGHSLGAAMATLAADLYGTVRAVYTFGSPRVGNSDFRDFRDSVGPPVYRFVNNNDLIVDLPPGRPVTAYRHVGAFKYFDESGKLVEDPSWWTRTKDGLRGHWEAFQEQLRDLARLDLDEINWDSLRDHSPTAYATNARAAVPR